jgi:hypothetical protein
MQTSNPVHRNFYAKYLNLSLKKPKWCLFLLLFLFSCGEKVLIDNSGQETWVFQLDGATHRLEPGAISEIRLDAGEHTLAFPSPSGAGKDTLIPFQVSREMFLHAPGSRYLLWKDLYGSQAKRNTLLQEQEFEWDSVLYKVDVSWLDTNQMVHTRDWDYGIGESFDEKIVLGSHQDEAVKVRLLRIEAFAKEYQKRAARN